VDLVRHAWFSLQKMALSFLTQFYHHLLDQLLLMMETSFSLIAMKILV